MNIGISIILCVFLLLDQLFRTHFLMRGFAKKFFLFSKNPRLLGKWVGGSRSLGIFFLENRPKIALNQY